MELKTRLWDSDLRRLAEEYEKWADWKTDYEYDDNIPFHVLKWLAADLEELAAYREAEKRRLTNV